MKEEKENNEYSILDEIMNKNENYDNENENESKNKKEIIMFPDTGTNDIYDNIYELNHQINFLKKQLKIEDKLIEDILQMKTL